MHRSAIIHFVGEPLIVSHVDKIYNHAIGWWHAMFSHVMSLALDVFPFHYGVVNGS